MCWLDSAKPSGEVATNGIRALPVTINAPGTPPGEDGTTRGIGLENEAQGEAEAPFGVSNGDDGEVDIDFLQLVKEAEQQALLYVNQVNRKAWSQSEHREPS